MAGLGAAGAGGGLMGLGAAGAGGGGGLTLEFLAPANICGQTLLKLVSRGTAIIAEMMRLSEHVPAAMLPSEDNVLAAKYAPILYDFRYLKTPEMFDKQVNTSAELAEADEEFFASHEAVLARFYALFENIFKYIADYDRYLKDLEGGFYIQHTVADVLLDTDGKQLMVEALYLLGVMLLVMDARLPGPIRERLIVAYYRKKGEGPTVSIVDLSRLCRDTGFRPADPHGKSRPANYPEDYFARFPPPPGIVSMLLTRLRSDDVYNLTRVYSRPDHRSFALANQASQLYVILYFSPVTLRDATKEMREIVDKHFSDNWVIPVYNGSVVDLTVEWERYKAAKSALAMDALKPESVRKVVEGHRAVLEAVSRQMSEYLTEGVLTEDYVVENLIPIMDCLRAANTTLRWILLHRRTDSKAFKPMLTDARTFGPPAGILDYMLRTALLELRLKTHVRHLLAVKHEKWDSDKASIAAMMTELAEYFSGARALTRVARDEDLMAWFNNLAAEVRALDYGDAIMAGRKIRLLMKALEDVTKFDAIDASATTKEFLSLARGLLTEMVRTVNVTPITQSDIETISDVSYAWDTLRDYVGEMHERIRRDPGSVSVLRALFLKLTSVVDRPMERILLAESRDAESVAQFYSGEVVAFLRRVMEIIPIIVFQTLEGIVKLQSQRMRELPTKFELIHLREYSQVDLRHELAARTHQIAVFTEGTLAMKKTLLGVIKVDPREILHDGIRKHVVEQVSRALYTMLVFEPKVNRTRDMKTVLTAQLEGLREVLVGFQRSFEYVQDYVGIYGLRMFQEEFTRIMAFNTEQEANRFLRVRIPADTSRFQSTAIPLPLFLRPPEGDKTGSITFMGRLVHALVSLTDPRRTMYGPGCLGGAWHDGGGTELAGLSLFSLLNAAVGVPGLTGVDRLLGFNIEGQLRVLVRSYAAELKAGADAMLAGLADELAPTTSASPASLKRLGGLVKKLTKPMDALQEFLLNVGHWQLLRRAVAHELRFSCRLDSNMLVGSLEAMNTAVVSDIRRAFLSPDTAPMPEGAFPAAVAAYCESAGINDPLSNIYVTTEPLPHLGLWLALFVLTQIGKYAYDREFGTLLRRKATDAVDGAPLVAGLVTLLKQMPPRVTHDFLSYLGQYVRALLAASVANPAKPVGLPLEVVSAMLLARDVARVAHVPDRVLHSHFPPHLLETVGTGVGGL